MDNKKLNIAIAGGPCTGKSTLAAYLYAHLKMDGYDYDLIGEECRRLKKEFGAFESPYERFYFWRQQEREELRSNAADGFITDKPLFHFYVQARQFQQTARDTLAVRELYRMCLEIPDDRYGLIVIAQNPDEVQYKTDCSRSSTKDTARKRHEMIENFIKHMWPEKICYISGDLETRTKTVTNRINELKLPNKPESLV